MAVAVAPSSRNRDAMSAGRSFSSIRNASNCMTHSWHIEMDAMVLANVFAIAEDAMGLDTAAGRWPRCFFSFCLAALLLSKVLQQHAHELAAAGLLYQAAWGAGCGGLGESSLAVAL